MERLQSNQTRLTAGRLGSSRILVFQPTPLLRVWPKGLAEGWQKLDEARKLMGENREAAAQAAKLVAEAAELGDSIVFAVQWARALKQTERADEAMAFLEAALARAEQDDWEYRMRAMPCSASCISIRAGWNAPPGNTASCSTTASGRCFPSKRRLSSLRRKTHRVTTSNRCGSSSQQSRHRMT